MKPRKLLTHENEFLKTVQTSMLERETGPKAAFEVTKILADLMAKNELQASKKTNWKKMNRTVSDLNEKEFKAAFIRDINKLCKEVKKSKEEDLPMLKDHVDFWKARLGKYKTSTFLRWMDKNLTKKQSDDFLKAGISLVF